MTSEEIVKALRQCAKSDCSSCGMCPIFPDRECVEHLVTAAASLIEQLIDENTELREEVNLRGNAVRTYEKKRAEAEAERDALREKVPQWISVEDRLPEVWINEEDDVLVNYMIYSPDFGVDIGNYHAKAKRWLCMAIPCTVTHWMPLPDAPEEGGKA